MNYSDYLLRIAVIGSGSAGTRHLNILCKEQNVKAVMLSRRSERVAQLVKQGIPAATKWSDILACHAAVIATDTANHVADICEALNSGINTLLVEKPLAPSLDSLKRFSDLITNNTHRIFVGCCMRFDAGLLKFREMLALVGQVYNIQVESRSYLPLWRPQRDYRQSYSAQRNQGGVLRDMIHEIDYVTWLFGMPKTVYGKLNFSGQLEISSEDQAVMFWTTPSGVSVSISLDYITRVPVRRMTAYGINGTLTWDAFARNVSIQIADTPPEIIEIGGSRDDMYVSQMKEFLSSVEGKNPQQLTTWSEGVQAVAICDAVRRSSKTGHTEEILSWNTA